MQRLGIEVRGQIEEGEVDDELNLPDMESKEQRQRQCSTKSAFAEQKRGEGWIEDGGDDGGNRGCCGVEGRRRGSRGSKGRRY